jgi:hypothetical protein
MVDHSLVEEPASLSRKDRLPVNFGAFAQFLGNFP